MQVAISMIRVITFRLMVTPKSAAMMLAIRGVARLKVVAVPARRAKTARRSIILPKKPSVCLPKMGRQASEYFCLSLFLGL